MTTSRLKLTLVVLVLLAVFVHADDPKPAPRTDRWGDPLPTGSVARLGTNRWRHEASVLYIAYTPDGKEVVTATTTGSIHVWDADTGKELRSFGHPVSSRNFAVALSPDGKVAVVGEQNTLLTLWEVTTGKELRSIKTERNVPTGFLVFARDSKSFFARCNDQVIRQFSVAEGKEIRTFGEPPDPNSRLSLHAGYGSVTVSSDGKTLLAATVESMNKKRHNFLRSWEIASGKELPAVDGPEGAFNRVAFSPDARLAAWTNSLGIIEAREVATGRVRTTFNTTTTVTAMSFSCDCRMLLTRMGPDLALQVLSIAEGKERLLVKEAPMLTPPPNPACNMAVSPDGRRVASATRGFALRQLDLATGAPISVDVTGHPWAVGQVALSSTGQSALTWGGDKTLHSWDVTTGKTTGRAILPVDVAHMAFSTDGRVAAAASPDGKLCIWDVLAERERKQWSAGVQPGQGISALALSPDGKTVAARAFDMSIRLWDSNGQGKRLADTGPDRPEDLPIGRPLTVGMVFSPDGSTLAAEVVELSGRQQVALYLWDTVTGKRRHKWTTPILNEGLASFTFSADGRTLIATTYIGRIVSWECASGKERSRFLLDQDDGPGVAKPLTSVPGRTTSVLTCSPDGKLLAVGTQDGRVHLCDRSSGQVRARFVGHRSQIFSLGFAANGKYLASGSLDGTALVWELPAAGEKRPAPALDAMQVEALWNDLAADEAGKASDAIGVLVQVPDQIVPLFKDRLQVVKVPSAETLTQLLTDLDSNVFATRKKAEIELEKMGELAEAPLRQALKEKPSLEMQKRLEGLLSRVAADVVPTGDQLRTLRALEVLEAIGTPEARAVLQRIAGGAAGARVTRDAQGTLDRLGNASPN